MCRYRLVHVCLLFAAGVAVQHAAALTPGQWLAVMALAAGAAAWSAAGANSVRSARRSGVLAAVLVLTWGGWWCARFEESLHDGLDRFVGAGPVVVHGVVVSHPEVEGERTYLVLDVREVRRGDDVANPRARVRVTVVDAPPVAYGDVVTVRAELRRPEPATNPGAFDYSAWLRRQGITATAFVRYARHFEVVGTAPPNRFMRAAGVLRQTVQQGLASVLPADDAAVVAAVVLGDRRPLAPETEDAFRRAGLSHLLTVSGLHVSFFVAVGHWMLQVLRVPSLPRTVIAVLLAWLYVLAVGARPPAVRAGVMATAGLMAGGLGRRRNPQAALAAGAMVLLIHNPLLLLDVSFQLSVAATAAIVLGVGPILRRLRRLPRPVAAGIALALAAQTGVMPLLAYTFHQLSLVGLVGSLLGVPVASVLVPVGLASGLFGAVAPDIGTWLGRAAALLVGGLVGLARWLARLPWATVDVTPPSPPFIAGWWLLWWGLVQTGVSRLRRRRLLLAAAALLALGLWLPLLADGSSGRLMMVVLDVGQGDAIFIRTPDGVTALIDGGGVAFSEGDATANPGESVIIPYLRYAGVGAVDVVVNTHPHEDHLQGLLPVLDGRPVALAVDGGQAAAGPSWSRYVQLVDDKPVTRWIARAGDVIRLGRHTLLEVLHPDGLLLGTRSDLNNNSVVLRLVYGDTAALLTGDIEAEAQLALLERGANLRAQVVKVPHHGSRWSLSTAFYQAVGAEIAVIPVGANNYGHPSPEVVEALARMGMSVYRTDTHGAVILTSDGAQWAVRTVRAH